MTCCEDRTKREVVEDNDGKLVERCTVCGCHHILLKFTPTHFSGEKKGKDA